MHILWKNLLDWRSLAAHICVIRKDNQKDSTNLREEQSKSTKGELGGDLRQEWRGSC